MAGVNTWLLAAILMVPALAIPVAIALRASANHRLAAVQLAGAYAALILAMTTFAFKQSSSIDLALCVTLLSVPGAYVYTVFMERWL